MTRSIVFTFCLTTTACAWSGNLDATAPPRYAQNNTSSPTTDASSTAPPTSSLSTEDQQQQKNICVAHQKWSRIYGGVNKGASFLGGASGIAALAAIAGVDTKEGAESDKTLAYVFASATIVAGVTAVVTGYLHDSRLEDYHQKGASGRDCRDILAPRY